MTPSLLVVETRARQSLGISGDPIYRAVAEAVTERHSGGDILIDVGCGAGNLWSYLGSRFDRYVGVDVVRYDGLPDKVDSTESTWTPAGLRCRTRLGMWWWPSRRSSTWRTPVRSSGN